MATLSITIELAWFQHGNENVPHQGPGLCLSQGYPLHSTGLPPTSTGVTLQYFIQEVLLAVFSKVTGARRKSPATSSVSAGYFWKSKLKKKIKKT